MTQPDHRRAPFFYGWIVIWTAFLGLILASGFRFSLGALIKPWEAEFGWTRDAISIAGSVGIIMTAIVPPFGGLLVDRFGSRIVLVVAVILVGVSAVLTSVMSQFWQLVLFFGVIGGLGGALSAPVIATPLAARWFVARRGLAVGIVSAAIPGAQMAVVPAVIYLIANTDWRTVALILGIVNLAFVAPLIAFFVRSNPEDVGTRAYGTGQRTSTPGRPLVEEPRDTGFVRATQTRPYWLMALGYFVCGFTSVGLIYTHFVPYAVGDLHYPESYAAQTFIVLGVFDLGGSILAGLVADRFGRAIPLGLTYLLRGVSYVVLMNATDPSLLLLFAALYGIGDVATFPLVASLTADLYGRRALGTIFGSIILVHQFGSAVGATYGGVIFRQFGSYQLAFITGITLLVAAGVMSFAIRERRSVPVTRPVATG